MKQLQRGGEEFREILMSTTKNNNNNTCRCSVIVLVFSMENCQFCAQFTPKIDRLAREYKDLHVGFVKCNIHESEANRRLANEAGVFGFPCAQMYDGHTGQKVQIEGGDVKGANEAKLREGLETHAYNVEKFDRLKRDAFEALSEAKAKNLCGRRRRRRTRTTTTTTTTTVRDFGENSHGVREQRDRKGGREIQTN